MPGLSRSGWEPASHPCCATSWPAPGRPTAGWASAYRAVWPRVWLTRSRKVPSTWAPWASSRSISAAVPTPAGGIRSLTSGFMAQPVASMGGWCRTTRCSSAAMSRKAKPCWLPGAHRRSLRAHRFPSAPAHLFPHAAGDGGANSGLFVPFQDVLDDARDRRGAGVGFKFLPASRESVHPPSFCEESQRAAFRWRAPLAADACACGR
jgi:hypothetical protein